MTKFLAALSMAALAGTALPQPAAAADLDRILLRAPELPLTKPVEVGTGWYLRGDLGYSLDTSSDPVSFRAYNGAGSYSSGRFHDNAIDSDWSGSVGFGYHFNDWLRSDITLEYTKGSFDDQLSLHCVATNPVGDCAAHQDFDAWGFMANAYLDLGTYAGFTPYIGGGAGIMSVNWKDMRLACVNSPACGAAAVNHGRHDWRFAYQLSAGMAYALTKNLKFDLGYRYFNVDGGDMFDFNPGDQALGATGVQGQDHGFSKQEIRAGLRYEIW
ncbi:MAG TPA: outer membrane protein [Pararhizobium sp.]|nr:outer membrane protein [Pararhizobium sp.]